MTDQALHLGSEQSIFCVVTPPDSGVPPRDVGVIVLNSGTIHNVGPFGLSVDLARSLSNAGFHVLRLDQTGKGESSEARRKGTDLETLRRDLELSCSALSERFSVRKVAILGLCSGADHGLQVAGIIDQTVALVMLDGWASRDLKYYVARYAPKLRQPLQLPRLLLKRLFRNRKQKSSEDAILQGVMETSGRRWNQPEMWTLIRGLCEKQMPVMAVFTGDSDDYYAYHGQLTAQLKKKGINTSRLTEVYNRHCKHLYPIVSHREKLVKDVTDWLARTA
jgi:hypothetical protein